MKLASELLKELPNIELPVVFMAYNGQFHTCERMKVVNGHIVIELRSADEKLQEFLEIYEKNNEWI